MLTRRHMLKSGAAAGLMSLSAPLFATVSPGQAVDPVLLDRAFAALERRRRFLARTDVFAVADFGRPSHEARFHLVDAGSGRVRSYHVAHGRGSDPGHSGWLDYFSNEPGSKASSAGAYVTGDFYHGKYGRSLRLHGLDPSNSNAEARAIVIHAAPYAEPDIIDRYGKLGRSEGCFALSEASHRAVLAQTGPGLLLYCDKV